MANTDEQQTLAKIIEIVVLGTKTVRTHLISNLNWSQEAQCIQKIWLLLLPHSYITFYIQGQLALCR